MGYTHRDLKPENVVINLDPLEVRIIDFDRVRLFTESSKGTALGTPGYFP
jgi:serine/threonine protein kinase